MLDARGEVLYVGKARALRSRVTNYTQVSRLTKRLQRMVSQTRSMLIVTTNTEAEALLLEAQLIKRYRPPYNVLLRDDKSFPFILLREDHNYPRVQLHRGARRAKGQYYGPFASAGSVRTTLTALQKLFLLRSCTDSFFANRSRPCLLYQIRRCSAPCVERIDKVGYFELVEDAKDFLGGKSTKVQAKLGAQMNEAAERQDYELAAVYRDRLRALTYVRGRRPSRSKGSAMPTCSRSPARAARCASRLLHPRRPELWPSQLLSPPTRTMCRRRGARQLPHPILRGKCRRPGTILSTGSLPRRNSSRAFSDLPNARSSLRVPQRGDQARMLRNAQRNAEEALERRLPRPPPRIQNLRAVAELFEMKGPPDLIEVYDNSHVMGTNAVGAMIVAGPEGFRKNSYRKFNIKREETAPGDDFAMMREVLGRRFARLEKEDPDRTKGDWPDLLLIDGGKGSSQPSARRWRMPASTTCRWWRSRRGRTATPARVMHLPGGREVTPAAQLAGALLPPAPARRSPPLRDRRAPPEARQEHGHQPARRGPGIGPSRKRALLMHFGTARAVKGAALEDLERAPGISRTMARGIYDYFHPRG
jgi:excinuclease ABC subunit C